MSDAIFAVKDPAIVLAETLDRYEDETGDKLATGDPRRIHLQSLVNLLVQIRSIIDFAGKQNLLRYVEDLYIDAYAALWGLTRKGPEPATCTQRFNFETVAARTIAAGVRVSDGSNIFAVTEDTTATDDHVDAPVECTVAGKAANGIAIGQIDTLVDPSLVPGCTGTENTTETISGSDAEGLEELRERIRGAPENQSTAGPRAAYRALALEASASVADAVALGPNDGDEMAGTPPDPGEVFVLIIKGERDDEGEVESVEPEPDAGLIEEVDEALSAEDVRPLTDSVTVKAPEIVEFDAIATYYIARSRSRQASEIQEAVEEAWDGYLLWQQSKIGRDINPSEMTTRLVNAGAKRVAVSSPAFTSLQRDESAKASYVQLVYGGVEDD